jgi:aminoglycoside phosphotransferase (APT) family kinase protein
MPADIGPKDIQDLLNTAGVTGFTGNYVSLGGGEGNDTFVLDCGVTKLVLRVARYSELNKLGHEARALRLLNLDQVPKLVYFDNSKLINGKAWIIESYVHGKPAESLSTERFERLGELLAKVHSVQLDGSLKLDFWQEFLDTKKPFGDEQAFLNHPNDEMRKLIRRGSDYFQSQELYDIQPSLIHGDISLGNMIINGDMVSLIDWEYSRFTDPMADFSTLFYEDMEQKKGKWRIHITGHDKAALFASYTKAGGIVDEERLKAWHNFDKLGGAIYFYWKLNHSGHPITQAQSALYNEELSKVLASLDRNL